MRTVYLELIFIDNLLLNILALYIAARLSGTEVKMGRITAAAAGGGVYAVLCALAPVLSWLLFKLAAGVGMCCGAFGFGGAGRFFSRLACVFISSMLMGGAALAFAYTGTGQLPYAARYTVLGGLFACWVLEWWRRRSARSAVTAGCSLDMEARVLGETVRLRCFVDTGNGLKDRLTGEAVIIAELSAMTNQLTAQSAERLRQVSRFCSAEPSLRPRVFSFETVGGSGLMAAIKPEELLVRVGNESFRCASYIALTERRLGLGAEALAGPELRLTTKV